MVSSICWSEPEANSLAHGPSQAAGGTQPIGEGSSAELQGMYWDRGSLGLSYPALVSALSHLSTVCVTLGVVLLPHGLHRAAGGRDRDQLPLLGPPRPDPTPSGPPAGALVSTGGRTRC